jgi:hypothetical protein
MANEVEQARYEFFVDAVKYHTDQTALSGAQVKEHANVPPTYQLYLEEEGDKPDKAISDGEFVHMNPPIKHFFAVPAATFGRS